MPPLSFLPEIAIPSADAFAPLSRFYFFTHRSFWPESLAGRMLLRHWISPDSPDVIAVTLDQQQTHRKGLPSPAYNCIELIMNDPFFFGYGSLVNRKTHDYGQAHPAKIKGWRRAWRRSPLRNLCFLTAVPDPDTTIEGLIAAVPNADWAALDIREHGYLRHEVTGHVEHGTKHDPQIAIYAIAPKEHASPTPENPILLSYLDVVVQGYLTEFGEDGVARFFQTTDGWHAPIMNDRANPIYPRAQSLTKAQIGLIDEYIAESRQSGPDLWRICATNW